MRTRTAPVSSVATTGFQSRSLTGVLGMALGRVNVNLAGEQAAACESIHGSLGVASAARPSGLATT